MNLKRIASFVLSVAIIFGCTTIVYAKETEVKESEYGIIVIGDSRTVGMKKVVDTKEENIFFTAKVGEGYNWFVKTGEVEAKSFIKNNSDIDNWVVVSNLGVNDLGNVDKYSKEYIIFKQNLESDFDNKDIKLCILSVNPVDESKCKSVSNSEIEKFNNSIKKVATSNEIYFIDSYKLVENILKTDDGLHYANSTYNGLYSYIKQSVEIISVNNDTIFLSSKSSKNYTEVSIK